MSGKPVNKVWTPSNVITMTRILLVPVFVAALLAPWPDWFGSIAAINHGWKPIVAAGIFVLISCTDWLDGYLARSRNEVTDFGKFMDPLADKILVAAALIALVELGSLPTWVALIILAREFIVSGVRMMAATEGVVIAASWLGKFKTVFQMIAIVLFTIKDSYMLGSFGDAIGDLLWVVSWIVMLVALGLTIASMIDYLYKARDLLGFGGKVESGVGESKRVDDLAEEVVARALERGITVSTAESLTGGMIGEAITSVAGSSAMFLGGVVSYASEVKRDVLGVDGALLESEGAVCEGVARQMAAGSKRLMGSDISVAVTGIAGPGGAEPGKPVGTVWIGLATDEGSTARELHIPGSREDVRKLTTVAALYAVLDELQ